MDDVVALDSSARSARRAPSLGRRGAAVAVYVVVAANAAVIVWLCPTLPSATCSCAALR